MSATPKTKRGPAKRRGKDDSAKLPGIATYADAIRAIDTASVSVTLAIETENVRLTQLGKVLWPATGDLPTYTRRDYMRYLLQVAPYILAHLRDRPLTLIRQPNGVNGRRFVHFHYEQPLPRFVETVEVYSEKAGRAEQYLLCNNAPTLLWLAHVGCLEFHGWHSRTNPNPDAKGAGTDCASSLDGLGASILNYPDYIVCDLDPYIYSGTEGPGTQPEFSAAAFERCKEVAFALKALLDAMALQSILKTSGRTGLHVLVPVVRTVTYDAARAVATALERHLMAQHPKLITMEQSVSKRTGKIFFDAGMNARVKTLATPYSPRAIAGAPVAMPLEWEELERAEPLDYTMANVPDILARRGDVWADILTRKQDVKRILAGA